MRRVWRHADKIDYSIGRLRWTRVLERSCSSGSSKVNRAVEGGRRGAQGTAAAADVFDRVDLECAFVNRGLPGVRVEYRKRPQAAAILRDCATGGGDDTGQRAIR